MAWIGFVDAMANNDLTKHNEVYNMNWIYCLTVMSERIIKMKENEKNK